MADQFVYVKDDKFSWIPGVLTEQTETEATVSVGIYREESQVLGGHDPTQRTKTVTVKLKDYPNRALPLQNVVDGAVQERADMIELGFLHEASILYNIKDRHQKQKPYTRTGDIIIAVNPFQWLQLYTEELRQTYARHLIHESNSSSNSSRDELDPHVYEVSALAFKGLNWEEENQSILVSGESGAGKTETVKIAMRFLASANLDGNNSEGGDSDVVTKVLDSNPLLEAFGNAQTLRNDNSSRFGKYTQLQFERNRQKLSLSGSVCEVYLLEKSRVIQHEPEERSFHIFHQLCAGEDATRRRFWDGLRGTDYNSFAYVGHSQKTVIEGVSDSDAFVTTLEKLQVIGVSGELLHTFMRAIISVLQIGNLTFSERNGDAEESKIVSMKELGDLAELMGIDTDALSTTLTTRKVKVRRDVTVVPLRPEVAKDSADALAKQIYERLFLWLVKTINKATSAAPPGNGEQGFGLIGLLDIFGFESFAVNGFEQLCINYANEQLQAKFTNDVFVSVFEEYRREGISLDDIKYDDNTDVLDLIQNRTGLLAILNEECVRPKGSDYGFVNKALHINKVSEVLIVPRIKHSELDFGIRHYAGDVIYNAEGFVTKNQDTLPSDLMECVAKSTNSIIAKSMGENLPSKSGPSKKPSNPKRGKSNLVAPTVWTKYKDQLRNLMLALSATQSRYIRCIKPNEAKKPRLMEHKLTLAQLRSSGVISAVTLARSAFPNRLEHHLVFNRFYSVLPRRIRQKLDKSDGSVDEKTRVLLEHVLSAEEEGGKSQFVMGKTRVYFRAGALEYLEAGRLEALTEPVIMFQSLIRGFLARRQFKKLKDRERLKELMHLSDSAETIQRAWRCCVARSRVEELLDIERRKEALRMENEAIVTVQCAVRVLLAKNERERRYVKYIRHQAKALKKQKKLRKLQAAATTIQRYQRGRDARKSLKDVMQKLDDKKHLEEKVSKLNKKISKVKRQIQKQRDEQALATNGGEINAHDAWEESVAAGKNGKLSEAEKAIVRLQDKYRQMQVKLKTVEGVVKPLKKNFKTIMNENKQLRQGYADIQAKTETMKAENKELVNKRRDTDDKVAELKGELQVASSRFVPLTNKRSDLHNALVEILENLDKRCRDDKLVADIRSMVYKATSTASKLQQSAEHAYVLKSPVKKRRGSLGDPSMMKSPGNPYLRSPGAPYGTGKPRSKQSLVRRKSISGAIEGIGSLNLEGSPAKPLRRKKKTVKP